MVLARRAAVLLAWAFWQGGFMFYGAVVVPTGSAVLGSDTAQGLVTRSVTRSLNLAGAVTLTVWAWDLATGSGRGRGRRWALWAGAVGLLGVLLWLHPQLDAFIDEDTIAGRNRLAFRELHRWYLRASTAQWGLVVALLVLTLRAWREEDSPRPAPELVR